MKSLELLRIIGNMAFADEPKASMDNSAGGDKRSSIRQFVLKGAKIVFNQSVVDCLVVSVSETGVRVRTGAIMPIPDKVTLWFNGGAVFSAERRWTRDTEIGFALDGTASLPEEAAQTAWQIYEMVRATSIEEPIKLLQISRFFDDLALQKMAEQAEAGLRQLETALAARARKSLR
jgi:hypothetical protein